MEKSGNFVSPESGNHRLSNDKEMFGNRYIPTRGDSYLNKH